VIDVQRVDYIRVPVTNMEEAIHFYGVVLGLERNPNSPGEDWVEYETGNVTLAVDEMWDSGVCHGAGLRDPAGNAILLHHRYKLHEQVS
jgi:catechol 2,3-dioxygenase-like lactoylglutathione lyase family enzyme